MESEPTTPPNLPLADEEESVPETDTRREDAPTLPPVVDVPPPAATQVPPPKGPEAEKKKKPVPYEKSFHWNRPIMAVGVIAALLVIGGIVGLIISRMN